MHKSPRLPRRRAPRRRGAVQSIHRWPIGTWRVGELREWLRDDNGAWWGEAQWRPDEPTRIIDTFPAAAIALA